MPLFRNALVVGALALVPALPGWTPRDDDSASRKQVVAQVERDAKAEIPGEARVGAADPVV